MKFNIEGRTQTVYACNDCGWCQIKKNFIKNGQELACGLCKGPADPVDEIQHSTGMSNFGYRQLLKTLEQNTDGVGSATVNNIEQHYDNPDNFLSAAKKAYQEMEFEELKQVNGIGDETVQNIALTVADEQEWDNGAIFQL